MFNSTRVEDQIQFLIRIDEEIIQHMKFPSKVAQKNLKSISIIPQYSFKYCSNYFKS